MEILLNRLKPFYIAKLEEVKDKYPSTYRNLLAVLSTEVIYGDVKVSDAMSLAHFLTDDTIDMYALNTELFNPLKIK
jgi:hypothetical protein|tara:strand:+ start:43 stop:273 length:231 start_codon:yes stop_codon:yes gene_type:complete